MNKLGYLFHEGFSSIGKHGFMSFASVTIIVACLIIMGSFSLLAVNVDQMIRKLETQNEMLAFVKEDYSESQARAIEPKLEAINNVSKVEFITREQAMDNFKKSYSNRSLFEGIDETTFRARYVIYLNDISLMQETQTQIGQVTGIDDVNAPIEISKGMVTFRNVVAAVSIILIVILFIVAVFIMSNTIKLTTFGRREEIAIMKMVGATNSFIRTPFVIEGLTLGILGAAIAFGLQWGIYTLITEKIMGTIAGKFINVLTVMPFTDLALDVGLVFLGVGVVVGAFGGAIAIRNYLKV